MRDRTVFRSTSSLRVADWLVQIDLVNRPFHSPLGFPASPDVTRLADSVNLWLADTLSHFQSEREWGLIRGSGILKTTMGCPTDGVPHGRT